MLVPDVFAPQPTSLPGPGFANAGSSAAENGAWLQAALEAGGTAAWQTDLQTRARWWSHAMFSLHGLQRGDAVPQNYLELVLDEDRPAVEAALRRSFAEGAHRVQYRVVWPDGSVHWIEGVGRTFHDDSGQPVSITGVAFDIDERKQQEADLQFVAQASLELARSSDYSETLRNLASMAVPRFADWCSVDMLDEAGELQRLAVAHVSPDKVSLAEELHRRYPPARDSTRGAWQVVRTAQPDLLEVISDEVLAQGASDAEHLAILRSLGLRSYMCVPLRVAEGVVGVITFVSAESGRTYGPRDLNVAVDLASRAALAVRNATLVQALRRSERRHGFLLQLTDVLRGTGTTTALLERVSAMLGQHFQVDRVGYGHVDETLDLIEYDVCWTRGGVAPLFGRFPASAFGQQVIDRLRGAHTVAIANVREHPLTSDQAALQTSQEVATRAILVVPLFKAGRLRTIVYLNQEPERHWTAEEIGLMEEVAERTRELIERGRTEAALRHSEARWRGLFETMSEGFFVAQVVRDAAGRVVDFGFLDVNPAFEKLTGIAPAAALGRSVTELLPGVDPALINAFGAVVDSGTSSEFELRIAALGDRWYEARAQRVGDDQFSVLLLEITARKRAQQALVEREAELREAQSLSALGGWSWDVGSDRTEASPELLRILGFPPEARLPGIIGQRDVIYPGPDWERLNAAVHAAVHAGTPFALDLRARRSDQFIWVTARGTAVRDAEGRIVRLRGTLQDITERKAIEEALRDADTRKDEFIATLAHELRNPLAPLRSGLAILRLAEPGSPAGVRARELMERQLAHMVRLVDDLLDVSRVSQGKMVLKRTEASLGDIVDLALETSRPLLEAGRHSLVVQLPSDPIWLHADATRIAQVLSNLLNNAAKYTPAGGNVVLEARRVGPDKVMLAVRDDGVGIRGEMLERVFSMFTQLDNGPGHAVGGLGIGLALAKRLVELHGGSIQAHSPGPGLGSTFTVELTTIPQGKSPVAFDSRVLPAAPTGPGRRRILVVDDNTDAAESLCMLLELEGHEVAVAHTGGEALACAPGLQPDVVFLDIGLPDIEGYEVAKVLRRDPALAGTLFVALTGWGADRDRARAGAAGFDMHLTKPVSLDMVTAALNPKG